MVLLRRNPPTQGQPGRGQGRCTRGSEPCSSLPEPRSDGKGRPCPPSRLPTALLERGGLPPARPRALPSQLTARYSLQRAGTLRRSLSSQTGFCLLLTALRPRAGPQADAGH